MLASWWLRLFEIDFDIAPRAGIKKQAVDALSKLKTSGEDDNGMKGDIPVAIIDFEEDRNDITEVLSYTAFQIWYHKNRMLVTIMSKENAFVGQKDAKWDKRSTLAEFISAQA